MAYLKSFPFTLLDLNFMQKQIEFRPLFDAGGHPIINWDGVGAIYDMAGNQIWDGTAGALTPAQATAQYGISYPTYTSSIGLRNIDGLYNNLFNVTWGNSDLPFLQRTPVVFDNYVQPLAASDPNAFYALKFAASPNPADADYTKTSNADSKTVVDYTPRMISKLTTTADVTFATSGGHLIKDGNGFTQVADYGQLAGGQQDGQRGVEINGDIGPTGFVQGTTAGTQNTGNNEWFFGATNPGVSPVNGWFALFGQFFDHGLDFVGKGADGEKIIINLAPDDPMYGVIDPSTGQPATKIVISRADVSGTVNGTTPQWNNHTSPFIDQSQTYGSHEQLTNLLREWVPIDPSDEASAYHMGARMFDGATSVTWKDAFGNTTNATLPTLNELRAHLTATGRADLTWEDVSNLRNRDAHGQVIDSDPGTAGVQGTGSGAALLLDSNPRFDEAHLMKGNDTQDTAITDAVNFLADLALNGDGTVGSRTGDTFELIPGGSLKLTLGSPLDVGGPDPLPTGTVLTGASALSLWVDFSNFGIMAPPAGNIGADPAGNLHDAVSAILMASVGDHYIAGDGRTNENIGLTAVHHVFHEEHNFQVQNLINSITKLDTREGVLLQTGTYDHALLHAWQTKVTAVPGATLSGGAILVGSDHYEDAAGNYVYANGQIAWNDDMLFNAAKMTVEMEYQHTAVDQFARTITPNLHEFVGYNSGENPTISLDFAQVAYRFGHSTLRESIDLMDPNGSITGAVMRVALEKAFLSPEKFAAMGAGAIALGMTHQQANEIDEFLTPAMNQGLLGLPLDLAAINIARGRDLGVPTLNKMREAIGLSTYTSWSDFGAGMLHPDNVVNFIAAYAFDGNVARAQAIIDLANYDPSTDTDGSVLTALLGNSWSYTIEQAVDFLGNADATLYGHDAFNQIDCWVGGLAEAHITGGLLGETFDTIFVDQIGRLMDGDRFYYLQRLNNIPYGQQIIDEQFKDIIERTTGVEHLNGSAFSYADQYYDLGASGTVPNHKYAATLADAADGTLFSTTILNPDTIGVYSDGGTTTSLNGRAITVGGVQYIRDIRVPNADTKANLPSGLTLDGVPNSGADSAEVIVGTDRNDFIHARGGDDTVYGEDGNDILYGDGGFADRLYGGAGMDTIFGGDGADLIDGGDGDDVLYGEQSATAAAGVDQVIGSAGNDYVDGGIGIDKLSGSEGDDVIFGGQDTDAFTHGGEGNDYIDGGIVGDLLWGDNGDDLIVGAADQDIVAGMQGDDILRPGPLSQSLTGGGDEVVGGDGVDDSGNDGKGRGFDLLDLSDWQAAPKGATFDLANQGNPLPAIDGAPQFPAVAQIEGVIGTRNDDTFTGDANDNWLIGGSGNDTLTGGIGNDLIVGNGIRLDTLIGTYDSAYNLYFDGASHRAFGYTNAAETAGLDRNFLQANGLLDAEGWGAQKHFTEMLKSAMFKDLVLGGSTVTDLWRNGVAQTTGEQHGTFGDGGTAGTSDVATFSANWSAYTLETKYFDLTDKTLHATADTNRIAVTKVTDGTAGRDGQDLVIGVKTLRFADGDYDVAAGILNSAPTFDNADTTATVAENGTSVGTYTATDQSVLGGAPPTAVTYSLSGADAARFTISAGGALSFVSAPNFEAPTDTGTNNVYNVTILATDAGGAVGTKALAVTVTNVNEAPLPVNDTVASVTEDTAVSGNVLTNDGDTDNVGANIDPHFVTEFTIDGTTYTAGATATFAAGTLVINADGSFTFTPASNYNGPVPSATYTVSDRVAGDPAALTATATLSFADVAAVNDAATGQIAIVSGVPSAVPGMQAATFTAINTIDDADKTTSVATHWQTYSTSTGWGDLGSSTGLSLTATAAGASGAVNVGVNELVRVAAVYNDTFQPGAATPIVIGSSESFVLGNGSTNTLTSATARSLVGLGGTTMIGFGGNDTYIVGSLDDVIIDSSGNDFVASSMIDVNLGAYAGIENGFVTGSGNLSVTGTAGNNYLYGQTSSGANVLTGLKGNDYYTVDVNDVVVELAGDGNDTVRIATSSFNLDLTATIGVGGPLRYANVENLSAYSGSTASLFGNAGNNVLDGQSSTGVNHLFGRVGNDVYEVGAGDVVHENAGEGTDTVRSATIDIDLASYAEVEIAQAIGTAARNLTAAATRAATLNGNDAHNVLTGGNLGDRLYGAGGQDDMTGGAGTDRFTFKAVADSRASTGIDRIMDFASGDKIDVRDIASGDLDGHFNWHALGDGSATVIGDLRQHVDGSDLILDFYTTNTATADMTIRLVGHAASGLTTTDFFL